MTPASHQPEPLTEITSILPTGVRPLHARSALTIAGREEGGPDSPQDSSVTGLEVSGGMPLHGTTGLTHGEDPANENALLKEAQL